MMVEMTVSEKAAKTVEKKVAPLDFSKVGLKVGD